MFQSNILTFLGEIGFFLNIQKKGSLIFSFAQRRKQTVCYLSVNIWVRALCPCLLLLQSA